MPITTKSALSTALVRAALFVASASALSGCAPGADEPAIAVEELSLTTLNAMVVAYATVDGSSFGPRQAFGPGVYLASAGDLSGVGNDATRLLEIAPAVRVRVCPNEPLSAVGCSVYDNLTGSNRRVTVVAGTSRIEVRPLVVGYRDANYAGVAQGFEIGRYDSLARIATVGNDAITSLRVAPGLKVKLCSDDPNLTAGGTCRFYSANVPQLPSGVDNSGSWLDVTPVTTAYQNASFAGASQSFGGGIYTFNDLFVVGNDAITSMVVPEGVITRACSDDPRNTVGYTCVTFGRSSMQLPAAIDNRTSWMDSSQNVILSPLNEEYTDAGTFTLRGYAVSPSGEQIPDARLRWSSDLDGFLGTGRTLTINLSAPPSGCGQRDHVITLTSTDSQGRVLTTRRILTINRIC